MPVMRYLIFFEKKIFFFFFFALKFFFFLFLFKFSKPKPNYTSNNNRSSSSLCHDFSFVLKKFSNPNSIENVFAFRMGESEINNRRGKENYENDGKKRRELTKVEKFYEELF